MPSTPDPTEPQRYVSRGGLKLAHALSEFGVDVNGLRCVDLGCSTGGFTDCLLQHGAASVTSIDTAYGIIDYTLRIDDRVTVVERTNALHAEPKSQRDLADLVVIDLGWTPQSRALPAALRWLKQNAESRIITLIKPHYEKSARDKTGPTQGGTLDHDEASEIVDGVVESLHTIGMESLAITKSPISGGKSAKKGSGNAEWLALIHRI